MDWGSVGQCCVSMPFVLFWTVPLLMLVRGVVIVEVMRGSTCKPDNNAMMINVYSQGSNCPNTGPGSGLHTARSHTARWCLIYFGLFDRSRMPYGSPSRCLHSANVPAARMLTAVCNVEILNRSSQKRYLSERLYVTIKLCVCVMPDKQICRVTTYRRPFCWSRCVEQSIWRLPAFGQCLVHHVYGTGCHHINAISVIVSDNLNGCSRVICLALETAALCDISVRSAVYKSSFLLTYFELN